MASVIKIVVLAERQKHKSVAQNRELRSTLNLVLAKVKMQSSGGKIAFQQMMLEQLDIYGQNMNFNLSLTLFTKVNSK